MVKLVACILAYPVVFGLGIYCGSSGKGAKEEVDKVSLKVSQRRIARVRGEDENQLATGPGRTLSKVEKEAFTSARPWQMALHSLDRDEMEKALISMKEALLGDDRYRQLMALVAFSSASEVVFDRVSFRSYAERLLDSPDPVIREKAFWMMYTGGVEDGDVDRIRALASDPAMHGALPSLLVGYEKGQLSPESSALVNRMLKATENRRLQHAIVRSLGRASCSEELLNSVIALSRSENSDLSYDIVYHVLSTTGKTPEVVERLVESLAIPREASRAAWGLRGVKDPRIATGMLQALVEGSRAEYGDALGLVGGATKDDLPLIRQGLQNSNLGEEAIAALKELEERLTRQ